MAVRETYVTRGHLGFPGTPTCHLFCGRRIGATLWPEAELQICEAHLGPPGVLEAQDHRGAAPCTGHEQPSTVCHLGCLNTP